MEKIYRFSISKKIEEIACIIIKSENDYDKNEGKMLLDFIWLVILDNFSENELQQKLEALFEFFEKQAINNELLINLDRKLSNSNNEEIKQAYLRYPIHDSIYEDGWHEINISRYVISLNKIKGYFETTTPNYIYEFLMSKNTLDRMIENIKVIAALIATKNQEGVLTRLIKYRKIQHASKSIKKLKSIWEENSNIVYKNINEDEKQRYEILLGERLKNA